MNWLESGYTQSDHGESTQSERKTPASQIGAFSLQAESSSNIPFQFEPVTAYRAYGLSKSL